MNGAQTVFDNSCNKKHQPGSCPLARVAVKVAAWDATVGLSAHRVSVCLCLVGAGCFASCVFSAACLLVCSCVLVCPCACLCACVLVCECVCVCLSFCLLARLGVFRLLSRAKPAQTPCQYFSRLRRRTFLLSNSSHEIPGRFLNAKASGRFKKCCFPATFTSGMLFLLLVCL